MLVDQSIFSKKCHQLRLDTMEVVRYAGRGHIASSFSIIETLVILFDYILRFDSKNPNWEKRDRFILSKGHGCFSYYAILANKGFFDRDEWKKTCHFDGILGGHPTKEKVPGVEASTGSLGHGLSIGVGFALNAKLENLDYKTYVMVGDGECNEGSIWEAALSASKHALDNLIVLVDYNKFQAFASTKEVCDLEPFVDKWKSFGFETYEVDMINSPLNLYEILRGKFISRQPKAIVCHTIKGQGVPWMEGNLEWHHKSKMSDEEVNAIVTYLKEQTT